MPLSSRKTWRLQAFKLLGAFLFLATRIGSLGLLMDTKEELENAGAEQTHVTVSDKR